MALQVQNSPFSEEQVELLNRLLLGITPSQQMWLSGYLTGLGIANDAPASVGLLEPQIPTAVKEVTILFGSQTGNGESLAEELTEKLKANNYNITLTSMSDFRPNALKKIDFLFIIVSTHGEGDPPDTAIPFHEFMHSRRAPKLEHLKYSVLSLGDSSYEFFCQTGKEFDEKLTELGATAIVPRVDCDLDYDERAAEWFENVLNALNEETKSAGSGQIGFPSTIVQAEEKPKYSRTNPFQAEVFENINLNGRGSNKETRHLEISLEGSGLTYEPGDSLGVLPQNDANLVDQIIEKAKWDPNETITVNKQGDELSLRDALLNYYEITVLTKPLIQNISLFTTDTDFHALLKENNKEALDEYIHGRDLLDLFTDFSSWNASAVEFTSKLRKMPARLYSIASSLEANPEEVHLTVGVVNYEIDGRKRYGVCSTQLAERVEPGDTLSVYVHKNNNFRLPENPDTPIIMIGPGTGIAPFRAFMEEREAIGATGKSWLFFGDQHYLTDFLYQIEWQKWVKDGVLTRMNVAFSRDQEEKVYVQHRMLEHRKELYKWIEEGAVIYVCGDEEYMAKDVHSTLLSILNTEGGLSEEEADSYLKNLIQEKRYLRDVY